MINTIFIEYTISIIISFVVYFINIRLLLKIDKLISKETFKRYIDLYIKKIHIVFIILCIAILIDIYMLFGLSFKIILNKIIYVNEYIYITLLFIFSIIKSVITTSILESILFKKYSKSIPFILNNKYINFQIMSIFPQKAKIKFFSTINLSLNIIFFTLLFI